MLLIASEPCWPWVQAFLLLHLSRAGPGREVGSRPLHSANYTELLDRIIRSRRLYRLTSRRSTRALRSSRRQRVNRLGAPTFDDSVPCEFINLHFSPFTGNRSMELCCRESTAEKQEKSERGAGKS